MTAKEYLGQAHGIDQRIKSKLEQDVSLRELAAKATSTLTNTPRSASPNLRSMENAVGKLVDLENEINSDIDTLVYLKREIVSAVNCVENPEHRTILEQRYLCFKPWEQIALDMGYDLRWIYRLHQKALAEIKIGRT